MGLLSFVRDRLPVNASRADGGSAAVSTFMPRPGSAPARSGPPVHKPNLLDTQRAASLEDTRTEDQKLADDLAKKYPNGKPKAWEDDGPKFGADWSNLEKGRTGIDAI